MRPRRSTDLRRLADATEAGGAGRPCADLERQLIPAPGVLQTALCCSAARVGQMPSEKRGDSPFITTNNQGGILAPSNFAHHFRGGRAGGKNNNGTEKVVIGMRQKAEHPLNISSHISRHTVGTRLVDLNMRPEISHAIMGHGVDGVRGLYGHATIEAMRKALEQLEEELFRGT